MKIRIFLFVFAAVIMTSCGGNKSSEKEPEEILNELEESLEDSFEQGADVKKFKDCDEFLDGYEKWVDAYVVFLEQYLKNPTDADLLQKYMKIMGEAAQWTTDWTNLISCAQEEKYQKRFDEISEKTEKKMKELGLD
jgi:hypothetical protein